MGNFKRPEWRRARVLRILLLPPCRPLLLLHYPLPTRYYTTPYQPATNPYRNQTWAANPSGHSSKRGKRTRRPLGRARRRCSTVRYVATRSQRTCPAIQARRSTVYDSIPLEGLAMHRICSRFTTWRNGCFYPIGSTPNPNRTTTRTLIAKFVRSVLSDSARSMRHGNIHRLPWMTMRRMLRIKRRFVDWFRIMFLSIPMSLVRRKSTLLRLT